jgi:hypothetical protein
LPNFQTAPDISQDINNPTTLSFAQTGYFKGNTPYSVYYQLPVTTGALEISVLPDLTQIIYDPTTAGILGYPANVPLLESETSLSATILRQVITNGVSSYVSYANLIDKADTLAVQGRQVLPGANITFEDATVTFAGQTTVGQTTYTNNYVLKIDGQAIPDLVVSADPNSNFTPDAGRFLVTVGYPTGQRSANWGPWIDTYKLTGAGGGVGPVGEPAPPLLPHVNVSVVPSEAGFQPPTSLTTNLMDAITRPWHLDLNTDLWSAPAFRGLGAVDLSFLGKGVEAFVAGMKDEATEQIHEFIENAAHANGLGYLAEVANQIQSASELQSTIKGHISNILTHLESDINSFMSGSFSAVDSGSYYDSEVNQLRLDVLPQAKTGDSRADAVMSKLFNSINILQHDSDPQIQLHVDLNDQKSMVTSPAGHYDFLIGSPQNDSFTFGTNGGFALTGAGNDLIKVGSGTDIVNGGAGYDTVMIPVLSSAATVTHNSDGSVTIVSSVGHDTLYNVESIQFTDKAIVGNSGTIKNDFNGDGKSDLLFQGSDGSVVTWDMNDHAHSGYTFSPVAASWQFQHTGDFNGDGSSDLLWRSTSGEVVTWTMNGHQYSGFDFGHVDTSWHVVGTGDFNSDGKSDILWHNTSGELVSWNMNNHTYAGVDYGHVDTIWSVAGTGDFNHDGTGDILWRNSGGELASWYMNGNGTHSGFDFGHVDNSFQVVGVGDFNGDGTSDILWRNTTNGHLISWDMKPDHSHVGFDFGAIDPSFQVVNVGDYNGDGKSDIVWRSTTTGHVVTWDMDDHAHTGFDHGAVSQSFHLLA